MFIISHRGNITGPNKKKENHPDQLVYVYNKLKFDIECDIWYYKNQWWLGHDSPIHRINKDFILENPFWYHCKNKSAFEKLYKFRDNIMYFWHNTDDYTITSNGYIWCYPNKPLIKNSICCLPELGHRGDIGKCYAVCTDYVMP